MKFTLTILFATVLSVGATDSAFAQRNYGAFFDGLNDGARAARGDYSQSESYFDRSNRERREIQTRYETEETTRQLRFVQQCLVDMRDGDNRSYACQSVK